MKVLKRKIHTLFHTPRIFMKKFEGSALFPYLPDAIALRIQYKNRFLKDLDLEHPETFNEKLQWLKLYDRRPEYTRMVDKYAAKAYVASVIGEEYIIPAYGVWDSFDDIDFDALPDQFVLKCTHGSGDAVIVRDKKKFDKAAAREKLTKSLRVDYYKIGREWPYKDVPRRILAEKYMAEESGLELNDYKVMCFCGKPKLIQVHMGRFGIHTQDFYDTDWNKLDIIQGSLQSNILLQRPEALGKMLQLSSMLSKNISQLRVDWYCVAGQLYFGELTFFDAGGFEQFSPAEWDYTLGEWIQLPEKGVF